MPQPSPLQELATGIRRMLTPPAPTQHHKMVENGEIVVPYVNSDDNLADFFTKPLNAKKFFALRDKIMNVRAPSHPCCIVNLT